MVSVEKIAYKFSRLDEFLAILKGMQSTPLDETRFVSPEMLPSRLDPRRVDLLAAKISAWPGKINRDLVPVSYYFQSVLWAAQFRGLESKLLRAAGGIPRGWLLDAPLGAFGLVLALFALRGRRSAARFLVPVAVMGFTSIVVELAMFIVFQANFGYVSGKIPLLLAVFMGGLVAGSLLARRRLHPGRAALPAVQAGLVAALAATHSSFSGQGGELVPFALLFAFGGLAGHLFVTSTRLLGAQPKDGPSAGVTMATALVSLVSGRKVKPKVGMTGEIILRGQVLPIGGVKEKVLAAHRNGLRTIILPKRNEQDLEDVPEEIKKEIKFVFVDTVDDVIKTALETARKTSPAKSNGRNKKAASRKTKANGKDTPRRR